MVIAQHHHHHHHDHHHSHHYLPHNDDIDCRRTGFTGRSATAAMTRATAPQSQGILIIDIVGKVVRDADDGD